VVNVDCCGKCVEKHTQCLTSIILNKEVTVIACVPGRVILFFKASVGPGPHCADSEQKSLAFIEEYWRMPVQPGDVLTSEFNCVRLYSTAPAVYYVIDAWRILGPTPIIRNPVHPSIPHGFLPKSLSVRALDYPHAKEESKAGRGDGSRQWVVNMWALMWGSHKPTSGALVLPNVMFECVSSSICGLPT